jgi:uncharacterized protein (DUF302 family)
MAYTVTVEASYKEVVAAVSSTLSRRGYHLVCSFDLQDAVAHHTEGCGCPYHGTALCTCQYVVLLAYPPDRLPAPPRVFTIHAYEQTTWVTLQPDRSIGAGETHVLHSALAEAAARPESEELPAVSCTASAVPASNN